MPVWYNEDTYTTKAEKVRSPDSPYVFIQIYRLFKPNDSQPVFDATTSTLTIGTSEGGTTTRTIAAGVTTDTVVKATPGRLCRMLVTTHRHQPPAGSR
jgi:hypothetical protein